mgnify:FL=1
MSIASSVQLMELRGKVAMTEGGRAHGIDDHQRIGEATARAMANVGAQGHSLGEKRRPQGKEGKAGT